MVKRAIVVLGDRTTHGGTVITGDATYTIQGRQAARVGDRVACPKCKGVFPIVTGAPTVFSRQSIARHGDTTSCGATLIASQTLSFIDDGEEAPAELDQLLTSLNDAQQEETPVSHSDNAVRFQALDPNTGLPVPHCPYIVTHADGAQHGGLTDSNGLTNAISTSAPQKVAVHFIFASALKDTIAIRELIK